MAKYLATYISFPGNTADAFTHWHDVFGGKLDLMRYGDMPPMDGMPFQPDPKSVAHVILETPFGVLTGGDSMDPGTDYPIGGTAYSLLLEADSVDEARGYFDKLIDAGGRVGMPFALAPWGTWYGQVFDKFGVMWAFSAEG